MSDDYEVGYGKPPKHGRFKKGQSGNPKGRPKGVKNIKTDFLEEQRERIKVREGGKLKTVTKQRAMCKTLSAKALQGDMKAIAMVVELAKGFDGSLWDSRPQDEYLSEKVDARERVRKRIEELAQRIHQDEAEDAACEVPEEPSQD